MTIKLTGSEDLSKKPPAFCIHGEVTLLGTKILRVYYSTVIEAKIDVLGKF